MINTIRITVLAIGTFFCISASAQDLMARQAPMDRQLKAVDSVSLQRVIRQEQSKMVSNLYPSWTNDRVNAYRDVEKPMVYKIDLRNFTMPTPSRNITSHFGYRPSFHRMHLGLDIKVYTGDTIVAAFSGKVRIVSYDADGFGYYVVIRHPNGLETIYGHLSKQLVHEDDIVRSGEPIGLGGSTGHSTGSHLHFETRLLGEPIDPSLMFDFPNQDVTNDYFVYHNPRGEASPSEGTTVTFRKDQRTASVSNEETESAQSGVKVLFHKVKKGDTLFSIARENGLTTAQLCDLNGISTKSHLRIGQILKLAN